MQNVFIYMMENLKTVYKPYVFLLAGLAFTALLYLAGCGKDEPDVFNKAPEFVEDPYTFTIAEDATSGAEVGTVAATDEDGDALTYTLDRIGATNFEIRDGTAVASGEAVPITVVIGIDLSLLAGDPITITVTASDGTNTTDAEVEITVNAAPAFANDPYAFNIASDVAEGTTVGTVSATDSNVGDRLTYTLSGDGAGHFAVGNTPVPSGEEMPVAVAAGADLPSLVSPVTITVTVNDGSNTADAEVEITVNAAPLFGETDYTFEIAEDAASGATVGAVSATDSNVSDRLTYTLSGNGAGHFAITDGTAVASGEEVFVTVAAGVDLSSLVSPVTIMVMVSDGGTPALTATAEVEIMIVAGNVAPVFANTPYSFNIASGAAEGATVGTLSATDSNVGDRLTYTLSGDGTGHFAVTDGTAVASGEKVSVTVAAGANLSSLVSPVTITATVNDGRTPALTATAEVEIAIVAGANMPPVFANTPYSFNIASGAADGATVGTVSATDADAGAMLTYSLSGTGAGHFEIKDGTAVASGEEVSVIVAAGANLSSLVSPVTITVTVDDGSNTATAEVEIAITAGNVAPVFAKTAYTFEPAEDIASGDEVGMVSATDFDVGDRLTYTLSGTGADHFEIKDGTDVASGEEASVVVAAGATLDHETDPSYMLQVQVSDDATPALTATVEVTVNVGDVNDNTPAFVGTPYTFSIAGNSPANTAVGTVAATDTDGMAMLAYTLSGTGAGHFAISNTLVPPSEAVPITVATGAGLSSLGSSVTITVTVNDGSNRANANVAIAILQDYDMDRDGLIEIMTLEQLGAIRWDLDGDGVASEGNEAPYVTAFPGLTASTDYIGYELTKDLDFADGGSYRSGTTNSAWTGGTGWDPIGGTFKSTFEGNGYVISNLFIRRTSPLVGLFAFMDENATIRNVGLTGLSVRGGDNTGGLVGSSAGQVVACYMVGNVGGGSNTGGLMGKNSGIVTACYATSILELSGISGGLVGANSGQITACYATGQVNGHVQPTGGLVGRNTGTIGACYAYNSVSSSGTNATIGGLVGNNSGVIRACYYATAGTVTGTGTNSIVGGLVGFNASGATVTASYATRNVTGNGHVGGLVGHNNSGSTLTACYATGAVTGTGVAVGGLVGSNSGGTLTACYATGAVTGTGTDIGGLVGAGAGTVTASYFDFSVNGTLTQGDEGKATTALKGPVDYDNNANATDGGSIYETWNVDIDGMTGADDPWDFGDDEQYPVLKVDFDGDDSTADDVVAQRS